ncbi:MAG: hypothetical protein PHF29_10185 [Candidatus Riflebacteria bacterium]|nr:hypothetical protein [Candidatus Riflebacteria bacterium]
MDKRRWIIVFSVFLCMTFALGFLKTHFKPVESVKKPVIGEGKKNDNFSKKELFEKAVDNAPTRIKDYGEIQYPEPAPHTFAVENSATIERHENEMKYKGKILK